MLLIKSAVFVLGNIVHSFPNIFMDNLNISVSHTEAK